MENIREAEHAISQAIKLVENTEALADFSGVFVNRAHARHLLGDIRGAEADYDRALALEPDLSEAHHAKVLLAVDRRDYDTVLREMKKVARESLTPEMIILFGLSYLALDGGARRLTRWMACSTTPARPAKFEFERAKSWSEPTENSMTPPLRRWWSPRWR